MSDAMFSSFVAVLTIILGLLVIIAVKMAAIHKILDERLPDD